MNGCQSRSEYACVSGERAFGSADSSPGSASGSSSESCVTRPSIQSECLSTLSSPPCWRGSWRGCSRRLCGTRADRPVVSHRPPSGTGLQVQGWRYSRGGCGRGGSGVGWLIGSRSSVVLRAADRECRPATCGSLGRPGPRCQLHQSGAPRRRAPRSVARAHGARGRCPDRPGRHPGRGRPARAVAVRRGFRRCSGRGSTSG
jgi:hypothetical protein